MSVNNYNKLLNNLLCPVGLDPLFYAVIYSPCGHITNESVAIKVFAQMNQNPLILSPKPLCVICKGEVKSYFKDRMMRAIAKNIFNLKTINTKKVFRLFTDEHKSPLREPHCMIPCCHRVSMFCKSLLENEMTNSKSDSLSCRVCKKQASSIIAEKRFKEISEFLFPLDTFNLNELQKSPIENVRKVILDLDKSKHLRKAKINAWIPITPDEFRDQIGQLNSWKVKGNTFHAINPIDSSLKQEADDNFIRILDDLLMPLGKCFDEVSAKSIIHFEIIDDTLIFTSKKDFEIKFKKSDYYISMDAFFEVLKKETLSSLEIDSDQKVNFHSITSDEWAQFFEESQNLLLSFMKYMHYKRDLWNKENLIVKPDSEAKVTKTNIGDENCICYHGSLIINKKKSIKAEEFLSANDFIQLMKANDYFEVVKECTISDIFRLTDELYDFDVIDFNATNIFKSFYVGLLLLIGKKCEVITSDSGNLDCKIDSRDSKIQFSQWISGKKLIIKADKMGYLRGSLNFLFSSMVDFEILQWELEPNRIFYVQELKNNSESKELIDNDSFIGGLSSLIPSGYELIFINIDLEFKFDDKLGIGISSSKGLIFKLQKANS